MPHYSREYERGRMYDRTYRGRMERRDYGAEYYHGGRGFGGPRRMERGGGYAGRGRDVPVHGPRDMRPSRADLARGWGGGAGYREGGWRGYETRPPRGGYERDVRGGDRSSYGRGYGERWETTRPEDIAVRNFGG